MCVPLGDVADDRLEARAERVGRLAHGLLVAIDADHANAIGQQPFGDRATDADGRARHDRDVPGRFRRAHAGRISLSISAGESCAPKRLRAMLVAGRGVVKTRSVTG